MYIFFKVTLTKISNANILTRKNNFVSHAKEY